MNDTAEQNVTVTIMADGMAVVTLNRPEKHNAMRLDMWLRLPELLAELDKNPDIRVVLLTGAGGNFCAGADISEFPETRSSDDAAHRYQLAVDRCQSALYELSVPTLAVIQGNCVGGGMGLALCCDFRIVGAGANFGITATKLGVVYGLVEVRHLASVIGVSASREFLYRGDLIDAEEALRIGLVHSVVPDDQLMLQARGWVGNMLYGAPLSIAAAKRALNAVAMMENERLAGESVNRIARKAVLSEDYREGQAAFREKRQPRFRGC